MTPYHFSLTVNADGSTHAFVLHRGCFVASRTFAKGELNELPTWLDDARIWTRNLAAAQSVQPTISYDHHDGMLHLCASLGQDVKFDPNSDESLAKLVRTLKRKAPTPIDTEPGEQPKLLPVPTDEELAHRTIFTQVGVADGAGKYSRVKSRYQQAAVSRERSQEIVTKLLADMFDL